MKITFEVPDTTRAAFLNVVFSHDDKMMLSGIAADSEEIERHDVIKFRKYHETTEHSAWHEWIAGRFGDVR